MRLLSRIFTGHCALLTLFALLALLPSIFSVRPQQAVAAQAAPLHPIAEQAAESALPVEPLALELLTDQLRWQNIAPGLESLELRLVLYRNENNQRSLRISPPRPGHKGDLVVLRTDPRQCEYVLLMASESGQSRSLRAWAAAYGLDAAINASMYLPENGKSTGLMRSASHVNNPRVVSKFGAFFLAGPRRAGLPPAQLLEKHELGAKPEAKIADYNLAVQNFRLTDAQGRVLWPESAETHSISALGRDKRGNILFIASEFQLSAPDFARLALFLPLEINLLMYLEGGTPAGMALLDPRALGPDRVYRAWHGKHGFFSRLGNFEDAALPNVLGVKSKTRP